MPWSTPGGPLFRKKEKRYAKRGSDKGGYPHGLGKKKIAAGGALVSRDNRSNLGKGITRAPFGRKSKSLTPICVTF